MRRIVRLVLLLATLFLAFGSGLLSEDGNGRFRVRRPKQRPKVGQKPLCTRIAKSYPLD
jgi:hypothetical protein